MHRASWLSPEGDALAPDTQHLAPLSDAQQAKLAAAALVTLASEDGDESAATGQETEACPSKNEAA